VRNDHGLWDLCFLFVLDAPQSDRTVDNPRFWAILLSRLRKRGTAPGGGMEYTHIADQLLGAGTALAGLILIFLSNAVTTYEAYSVSRRREL
jgi:hypothetical protein